MSWKIELNKSYCPYENININEEGITILCEFDYNEVIECTEDNCPIKINKE